jgi:predicted MFS family arabinose efflux permease
VLLLLLPQVAGSVSSPFLLDAYLAGRGSRARTHRLSAWASAIMAAACCAVIPLAKVLPALAIALAIAGSAQAAVEAMTYIHIAKRLDRLQRSTAVHVSMAMYILAQTTGGGLGSLLGSALLQQPWVVQVAAQAAVCGAAGMYGVALGLIHHRGWCCKDAFMQPAVDGQLGQP